MDRFKDWFLDLPFTQKIGYMIFSVVILILLVLSVSSMFASEAKPPAEEEIQIPIVEASPTSTPTPTPDVPSAEPLSDGDTDLKPLAPTKLSVDEQRKALDVARAFTFDFSNWRKGQTYNQRKALIAKHTVGNSGSFDYDPILAQSFDAHFDDSDQNPNTTKVTMVSYGSISALSIAGGDEKRLRVLSTASVRILDIDPNTGQGMTKVMIYPMVYVLDLTKDKGNWKVTTVASHS